MIHIYVSNLSYNKNSHSNMFITTIFPTPIRRKVSFRRRRPPSVRLGGKKLGRRFNLVRLLKRVKLRWMKLKYSRLLKKLKEYYRCLVENLSSAEAYHQRMLLETSFAIPVMGLSFNSYPSNLVTF